MTTDDVIVRFEKEYQGYHGITPERARQQVKLLREFELHMGKALLDADAGDLQGFAGHLVASGLHVNTVRKKLNMVRPFASWAYAVNLIDADRYMKLRTVKNPRGSTGNSLPNPYTRTEIQEFWRQLDATMPKLPEKGRGSQALTRWLTGVGPWGRVWRHAMRIQIDAMVRLALDMGLRRSEIFGLSVDDLHYDNEYLVVRGKADPNTGQPKIREIPFTETARAAVKEWVEFRSLLRPGHNRPWLTCWADRFNQPMRERRFHSLLQDRVGPQWRWHRFRHTCGTEWLRAGMALEKVQRLLGHATLQQTLGYAEIARGDLSTAMARGEASFEEAVGRAA
jgi:site-specific recombinase XerD